MSTSRQISAPVRPSPPRPVEIEPAVAKALLEGTDSTTAKGWLRSAGRSLELAGVVLFPLSELHPSEATAHELAAAITEGLIATLAESGLPSAARVEIDAVQTTEVPPSHLTRTVLPHHDGGHCSFLTPSAADVPDWKPAERTFAEENYCTTEAHKLYQGILVLEPGEGRSLTGYYPWVPLVSRAFRLRQGRPGSTTELARWLAGNLRSAQRAQEWSGSSYPSLAACLGARSRAAFAVVPHCAESEVNPALLQRYPELEQIAASCRCGSCAGPTGRIFCNLIADVLGLTWVELRQQFELPVESRRLDFVVGHNLTFVHSGIEGGRSRVLLPISIVLDFPGGAEYETWLGGQWRRWAACG